MDAFVLAGGRSSRMGADKARAWCRGLPLAVAVAEILGRRADRVVLVRRDDDGPFPDRLGRALPVLVEPPEPDRHPLFGVAAALGAAASDLVLVAPCDLPRLDDASVDALLAVGGPVVAVDADGNPSLLAVLPRSMGPEARRIALVGGSARSLCAGLPTMALGDTLRDADTPDALGDGPLRRLTTTLAFLGPDALARALDGERARLLARGIVDPTDPGRG